MSKCCYDSDSNKKNKYTFLEEAEKVALSRVQNGTVLKIYECEEGDGYHLTSKHLPLAYNYTQLDSLYEEENEKYEYSEEEVNELKYKVIDLHKEMSDAKEKLETARKAYLSSKKDYQLAKTSFRNQNSQTYKLELANNRVLNNCHKYLKEYKT